MVFWFPDEDDVRISSYNSRTHKPSYIHEEEEEDATENEEKNEINYDERRAFWDLQEELLQSILYRTTSFEAKVRQSAKDALTKLKADGGSGGGVCGCSCRKTVAANCGRCGIKDMSIMLQNKGFDCVVCVSKWKSSSEIPAAGQHTYLEVVQSEDLKKGEMKVIIELNLRTEFAMARSSKEYQNLVTKLPEMFVGRVERLNNIIKILCGASKRCMKERKRHVAPWRKHEYMKAKWQGQPLLQAAPPFIAEVPPKAAAEKRASILSFHFYVDTNTRGHNKVVEVI